MEARKPRAIVKPYKPIAKPTPQPEWGEEAEYLESDYYLYTSIYPWLKPWIFTRRVVPVFILPVNYNRERARLELLKQPIFTEDGSLRVAVKGSAIEEYEVNPSSQVTGYVTIEGAEEKVETFTRHTSVVDIFTADYDLYVQFSVDGIKWLPKILLRGSQYMTYSVNVRAIAVKFANVVTDGSQNARYQVIGWL